MIALDLRECGGGASAVAEPAGEETTDLSEPLSPSVVTCLIGVFDPSANDAAIEAAVSDAARTGASESGPQGINAELGAAAVERIASVRAEPAPMDIKPAPIVPTAPAVTPSKSKHAWTPPASFSDRFDPALPEGRRRAPQPVDWERLLHVRRRPVREKTPKHLGGVEPIDTAFMARAFRFFVVLTFALAVWRRFYARIARGPENRQRQRTQ